MEASPTVQRVLASVQRRRGNQGSAQGRPNVGRTSSAAITLTHTGTAAAAAGKAERPRGDGERPSGDGERPRAPAGETKAPEGSREPSVQGQALASEEWDDDAVSRVQSVQYIASKDASKYSGATFVLLDRDVLWLADGGSLTASLRHDGVGVSTQVLLQSWNLPVTGNQSRPITAPPHLGNKRLRVLSFWPYPATPAGPALARGPQWAVAFLFTSSDRVPAVPARARVNKPSATQSHTRVGVWDVASRRAFELPLHGARKEEVLPRGAHVVELHSLGHLVIGVCNAVDGVPKAVVWDVRRPDGMCAA